MLRRHSTTILTILFYLGTSGVEVQCGGERQEPLSDLQLFGRCAVGAGALCAAKFCREQVGLACRGVSDCPALFQLDGCQGAELVAFVTTFLVTAGFLAFVLLPSVRRRAIDRWLSLFPRQSARPSRAERVERSRERRAGTSRLVESKLAAGTWPWVQKVS